MPHQPQTGPPRTTPRVNIPDVDFRHFARDPVGAGLAPLRNTLKAGARSLELKEIAVKDQQAAADLRQAEIFFTAVEAKGVERFEIDALTELEGILGRPIQTQRKSFADRIVGGNGRIFGLEKAKILEAAVINGEFKTSAQLEEFYNAQVEEAVARNANPTYVAGFFEVTKGDMLRHRTTVVQLNASNTLDAAKAGFGEELRGYFSTFTESNDTDALGDFFDSVADTFSEMQDISPGDLMTAEEVLVDTAFELAANPDNIGFLDEYRDAVDSLLTDPKLRPRLAQLVDQSQAEAEVGLLEATPEQREAVSPLINELSTLLARGEDIPEDMFEKIDKLGGIAGIIAARTTVSNHQALAAAKFGDEPPSPELIAQLKTYQIDSRPDRVRAALTPALKVMLASTPAGLVILNDAIDYLSAEEKGKFAGIREHVGRLEAVLVEAGVPVEARATAAGDFYTQIFEAEDPLNVSELVSLREAGAKTAIALDDVERRKTRVETGMKVVASPDEGTQLIRAELDRLELLQPVIEKAEGVLEKQVVIAEEFFFVIKPLGVDVTLGRPEVQAERGLRALAYTDLKSAQSELGGFLDEQRAILDDIDAARIKLARAIRLAPRDELTEEARTDAAYWLDRSETIVEEERLK